MDPKDVIKTKIDLVELIGEYLDLKKAGSGSFRALCPFHQEKSPSFHVSSEKQIWHCFGCGEGGDAFAFVMKMDGVDFSEALQLLGKKTGVEIPRFSSVQTNEKQRLLEINQIATHFFQKILIDAPKAIIVRDYLQKRGIPLELAQTFQLGYAPQAWDMLVQFFHKRGYALKEIEKAGLILPRRDRPGYIDRFRHRLMIPLHDLHGNIVGFTGRVLSPQDNPKYMNSPESVLYHKGEVLFGLHLAKPFIREQKSVIIVEGNLDVIASHKAQVKHVVASSGTALTEMQLTLLKRFTDHLIFCFDQDPAGFAAAKRGIHLARQMDFRVDTLSFSAQDGKDPDEIVQKDPQEWQTLSQKRIPVMQYVIDQSIKNKDLSDIQEKIQLSKLLGEELSLMSNLVEQEYWLQHVADLLKTSKESLRQSFPKVSAVNNVKEKNTAKDVKPFGETKSHRAGELLLSILLQPLLSPEMFFTEFDPSLLPAGNLQEIGRMIMICYNSADISFAQQSILGQCSKRFSQQPQGEHIISLLRAFALHGETLFTEQSADQVQKQFKEGLAVLKQEHVRQKQEELTRAIRQAEAQGDTQKVEDLVRLYQDLRSSSK